MPDHSAPRSDRYAAAVTLAKNLYNQCRRFPFETIMSLITIPIGLAAIVVGPHVSRAFTIVYPHRPAVVYVWGVWLLAGGFTAASGIFRGKRANERAGLLVLVAPFGFYAASVLIGLGTAGLVTGLMFSGLTLACLLRAAVILSEASATTRALALGNPPVGDREPSR